MPGTQGRSQTRSRNRSQSPSKANTFIKRSLSPTKWNSQQYRDDQNSRPQSPASPSKWSTFGDKTPQSSPRKTSNGSVLSNSTVHNRDGSHSSRKSREPPSPSKETPGKRQRAILERRPPPPPPAALGLDEKLPPAAVEEQFNAMLNEREVPADIRTKLAHLGLQIKESLVRNQHSISLASLGALGDSTAAAIARQKDKVAGRSVSPFQNLKAMKSASSFFSGIGGQLNSDDEDENDQDGGNGFLRPPGAKKLFGSSRSSSGRSDDSGKSRPSSPRGRSAAQMPTLSRSVSPSKSSPSKAGSSSASSTARDYALHLLQTSSSKLDIEKLKRLRMLLSTESPQWLADFLFTERGYEGLWKRIGELIEMEWREEIHDDRALHELLRGMLALGATDRGQLALSSLLFRPYVSQLSPGALPAQHKSLPMTAAAALMGREEAPPELPLSWELHPPFGPLVGMLLSERKPGDLTTRKALVEILSLLPAMQLPPGLNHRCFAGLRKDREVSACYSTFEQTNSVSTSHLLLLLLHNPVQQRSLSLLPFISQSHHPRPFKTYLLEIAGVVRDYFWIFCHSQNKFWDWEGLGEEGRSQIAGPKVPGGMTGGVEFEAMAYISAHMKLINRLAELLLRSGNLAAKQFHSALFDSGLERIISTLRRSSQQYYAPLHLSLAYYLYLATESGYNLPVNVSSWCNRPPLQLRLPTSWSPATTPMQSPPAVASPQRKQVPIFHSDAEAGPSRPMRNPNYFDASPERQRPVREARKTHLDDAAEVASSLLSAPASSAQPSSPSTSSFEVGTGKWLGHGNTAAAAWLATSSASETDFFDGVWPDAPAPIEPGQNQHRIASIDKALPPSPKKSSMTVESLLPTSPSTSTIVDRMAPVSPMLTDADMEPRYTNVRGSVQILNGTARDRIKMWEGMASAPKRGEANRRA